MPELDRSRPAVFVDRDGTLNVEKAYVHKVADWAWLPGAPEAVARLCALDFLVIVVTNQAGIGRGYYGADQVERLHRHAQRELANYGGQVAGFYFCPHLPGRDGQPGCPCRKPEPGMIHQAAAEWNIDLGRSFLVGDKASDVEAGRAAGVESILVLTGYGSEQRQDCPKDVAVAADLGAAVSRIEGRLTERP